MSLRPLAVAVVVATGVFAGFTFVRYREFATYQKMHLPPWQRAPVSSDACLDWTLHWGTNCVGLPTLCEVHARSLMAECLHSADRTNLCERVAAASQITSFGYQECAKRQATEGLSKNTCADLFRVIADFCAAAKR